MDPQILPLNNSNNDRQEELQLPDNNNKTIHLSTTNKNKLVFLKPNNVNNKMYCVLRPEDLQLRLPSPVKVPKPGRPKRVHNEEHLDLDTLENNIEEVPRKVFRTRSGRVTKPPRYINQELSNKIEHHLETPVLFNDKQTASEIKDNKLSNIKPEKTSIVIEHKRNISSQYRCGTCKKAYLGRAKMLKHLQLNSDHVAPKFFKNDKNKHDLWNDLINKSKTVPQDEQVRFIYNEFVAFVQKAREVFPKLLKSETDEKNNCITVDQVFSNALGVPEGCYSFIKQNVADIINIGNKNGIKESKHFKLNKSSENLNLHSESVTSSENLTNGYITTQNKESNEKEFVQEITNSDIQNTDQNSLLNLLDTGQVTFDNSNSEEVMNVDQLIHERLKSLTGGEIETNSASHNLHLDLSLDMFPYHTNNL